MSTWGPGPYDNDQAAAWCDDLDDAADAGGPSAATAFAVETLRAGAGDEPGRVVAAAAWLVAGLPGVAEPLDGPSTPPVTPDPAWADDATAALGEVLADDEWAARWTDPAEREAGRAYVRSLVETWEVAAR